MAGLTLRNVHKSFGKVKVIHGIDMEVKDGEFIVIVGRIALITKLIFIWWILMEKLIYFLV